MGRDAKAFEADPTNFMQTLQAGAYYFFQDGTGRKVGIVHACPCGCGARSALSFRGVGAPQEWDVVGEWPNVTLSPSIGVHKHEEGHYHWHGYLENGMWIEK